MKKNSFLVPFLVLTIVFGISATADASQATLSSQKIQNLNSKDSNENFQQVASTQIKGGVNVLKTKYVLLPGDNISFSIFGEPEMSQSGILVRPDGNATIEPFGEVQVAGLSIEDLNSLLTNKFKKYLLEPMISVKINNYKTAKVYVKGAVNRTGVFEQQRFPQTDPVSGNTIYSLNDLTIASVLSGMGGVRHDADLENVKITNKYSQTEQSVNLLRLIKDGDGSQNIFLTSGDTVFVPTKMTDSQLSDEDFKLIANASISPSAFQVRVIGAVEKPGLYEINAQRPELNSALAAAEGFANEANRNVVKVKRTTPKGNVATIFVDPKSNNLVLRPNDVVEVVSKKTAVFARDMGFLGDILYPFARFADTYNGWAEMFDPTRRYDWRD